MKPTSTPLLLLAALLAGLTTGCSGLTYDRIKLRESPQQYEKKLPAEQSRRTSVGLCSFSRSMDGRTDAIVLLLSSDRRVAGKLHATRIERNWGLMSQASFTLVGELDPEIYDLRATGPLDTLRVIARSLSEYRGEALANDAHNLVTAGLVRLLQRWPRVEDVGVSSQKLPELFEKAGGGGEALIAVDADGIYRFEYRQGVAR